MGEFASSTTSKIYIQAHEQNAVSAALHPPKFWDRFVDDIYSLTYSLFSSRQQSSSKHYIYHGGRKKWRTIIS